MYLINLRIKEKGRKKGEKKKRKLICGERISCDLIGYAARDNNLWLVGHLSMHRSFRFGLKDRQGNFFSEISKIHVLHMVASIWHQQSSKEMVNYIALNHFDHDVSDVKA